MNDAEKTVRAIKSAVLPDAQHGSVHVDRDEKRDRGGFQLYRKRVEARTYYYQQGLLSDSQNKSAHRIGRDFEIAGIFVPTGMKYTPGGGEAGMGEGQLEARDNWRRAVDALPTHEMQQIIIEVCCYGKFVAHVESEKYRSRQRKMILLREGLDVLTVHYARLRAEGRK